MAYKCKCFSLFRRDRHGLYCMLYRCWSLHFEPWWYSSWLMCMTTLPVKYYHVNCNVYVGVVLLRSLHTFLLHQWSSGRRLRVPQCCSRRRIRKYTIYIGLSNVHSMLKIAHMIIMSLKEIAWRCQNSILHFITWLVSLHGAAYIYNVYRFGDLNRCSWWCVDHVYLASINL